MALFAIIQCKKIIVRRNVHVLNFYEPLHARDFFYCTNKSFYTFDSLQYDYFLRHKPLSISLQLRSARVERMLELLESWRQPIPLPGTIREVNAPRSSTLFPPWSGFSRSGKN